jgi:hypothetical protein
MSFRPQRRWHRGARGTEDETGAQNGGELTLHKRTLAIRDNLIRDDFCQIDTTRASSA